MTLVLAADRRVTITPNATMTTLASPTLGAATNRLWLVDMNPGAVGPVHAFDAEVLWAITTGDGVLHIDGERHELGAGDTVVLPGGTLRRFVAGPAGFTAVVATAGAGVVVRDDDQPGVVPPWVA